MARPHQAAALAGGHERGTRLMDRPHADEPLEQMQHRNVNAMKNGVGGERVKHAAATQPKESVRQSAVFGVGGTRTADWQTQVVWRLQMASRTQVFGAGWSERQPLGEPAQPAQERAPAKACGTARCASRVREWRSGPTRDSVVLPKSAIRVLPAVCPRSASLPSEQGG